MSSNRKAQRNWHKWWRYLRRVPDFNFGTPGATNAYKRIMNNKNSGRRTEWKNYEGPK